jgi:hypothetical protein
MIEYLYGEWLCEIPVQNDSDIWLFRCGHTPEKGYEIYGVWAGFNSSTKMFNRNVISLSRLAGQKLHLLYPVYTPDGIQSRLGYERGAKQQVKRVMQIDLKPLPPGTYYIQYVVEDMFLRRIPMEWVAVQWDGERLTLADDAVWEGTVSLRWE